LLPFRVKALFSGDGELLHIRMSGDTVLVERADTMERWTLPGQGDCLIPASLQAILQGGAGAVLFLPAGMTLLRKVELPLAAASQIHSATSFLIDRFTPFRAEQTYHSTRLLSRDRERKRLVIELAIVPRQMLNNLIATLATRRIPVSSVRIEGKDHSDFDFAPSRISDPQFDAKMQRTWKPILAAGLALLVVGPLAVTYRVQSQRSALTAEIAAAEGPGRRAAALRSEVEMRGAERAFLPRRLRSVRAIEVLDALTKVMPDDSWLFSIEIRPGQATLAGFSPDVPALIERLSRSPFANPELTAPVVSGLGGGKSRFELRVQATDIGT
jgi:general secretion pathway protein L